MFGYERGQCGEHRGGKCRLPLQIGKIYVGGKIAQTETAIDVVTFKPLVMRVGPQRPAGAPEIKSRAAIAVVDREHAARLPCGQPFPQPGAIAFLHFHPLPVRPGM